jgi:hypothetical protein
MESVRVSTRRLYKHRASSINLSLESPHLSPLPSGERVGGGGIVLQIEHIDLKFNIKVSSFSVHSAHPLPAAGRCSAGTTGGEREEGIVS